METTTKTYGVEGLTDWQCVIHVGKAKATVHFEGGMMTRYGITPAEYTTSDAIKQRIIEQSDYFKQGRIKLLGVSKPKEGRRKGVENVRNKVKDVPSVQEEERVVQQVEKICQDAADSTCDEDILEVEVACLTDAQNYLKEHFGIPSYKIKNWDKAHAVASENGVIFKGVE